MVDGRRDRPRRTMKSLLISQGLHVGDGHGAVGDRDIDEHPARS